jgi:uncharacterized protein DUF5825
LSTGDRAGAPAGTVFDVDPAQSLVGFDVAAIVGAGACVLRLTSAVCLTSDDPQATLAVIRLLRDAAALGVKVAWRGTVGDGVDPGLLVHLDPPELSAGEPEAEAITDWRRRHQPGLCYFRLGPDFVFVKDVRVPGSSSRFRLDGMVDAFRALEPVVEVASLDTAASALLTDLDEERLVLRFGELATLLPIRMRRWPVPAMEI